MNAYEFMSASPILTLLLALIASMLVFRVWNSFWRHWNIRKHGYPPPHCDAHGELHIESIAADNQ